MVNAKTRRARAAAKAAQSSKAAPFRPQPKRVGNTGTARTTSNETVVHRRELVKTLIGTTNPQLFSFDLDPTDPVSFPWLHPIGALYERYRIRRLRAEFVSRTPATIGGVIALAYDYDALDRAPIDIESLLSYEGAISQNVWSGTQCAARPDRLHPGGIPKYTGNEGGDRRLESAGVLNVGISRDVDGVAGELWLDYEIVFTAPQKAVIPTLTGGPTVLDFVNQVNPIANLLFPTTGSVGALKTERNGVGLILPPQVGNLTGAFGFPIEGLYELLTTFMEESSAPSSTGARDITNVCIEYTDDDGATWLPLTAAVNDGIEDTFMRMEVQRNAANFSVATGVQKSISQVVAVTKAAIAAGRFFRHAASTNLWPSDGAYSFLRDFSSMLINRV